MPEKCGEIEVVENPSRGGSGLVMLFVVAALIGGYLRSRGDL